MLVNSNSDFLLAINSYESLVATVRNKKTDEERKQYNQKVSRLSMVIGEYRFHHALDLVVFRDERLIGVFSGTSDLDAVRYFEQLSRDSYGFTTEFSIYRTFSYNNNYEYVVGLLIKPLDVESPVGLKIEDIAMFKSTLEYFCIGDWFDTSYPSMPV